ncbi:hypothetical protein G5V59_26915 [Nocardioides sp. W3-2-3]|uniref:hypothetical protein n=1 Tax=Nocardioides convexus TaxID=2712224 RepID=UPI002418671D|nr:hypothetical protein [Nocardioides convexus]NHA02025.1 hypothetical protein [Nocardioides convexus]
MVDEEAPAPASPLMTQVPQRGLGVGNTGAPTDWWNSLTLEKVPESRWPTAYGVYDDMLTSPQVAGVFSAVVQTILGTGWRLDGTGCDDEITQHCARDLSVPVVGSTDEDDDSSTLSFEDKFSWDEHVEIAIDEYLPLRALDLRAEGAVGRGRPVAPVQGSAGAQAARSAASTSLVTAASSRSSRARAPVAPSSFRLHRPSRPPSPSRASSCTSAIAAAATGAASRSSGRPTPPG